MEKTYFYLLLMFSVDHAYVPFNNHDNPNQSLEDNKLIALLFRQVQDMGAMMTDIKTLIVLQSQNMAQQQRELSDMKMQITQQQRDLSEMKTQITQQQGDLSEMKTQMTQQHSDLNDVKTQMTQQQHDLSEMKTQMTQQQRDLSKMKTQMTQQYSDLRDMKTQVTQQHSDMSDIKTLIKLQMRQIIEQQGDLSDIKSLMNQQLQQCTKSDEEEDIRGGCEGNITGLTTMYIKQSPIKVPCDGAGWVVMLRRVNNEHNFPTNDWEAYKHGFGDPPNGSFWLGLETIHRFTSHGWAKLRVELEDWNRNTTWAEYSYVRVLGESSGYKLLVSGYTGTAGDVLYYNNGMKFSTIDRDNDLAIGSCAAGEGGWWFKSCSKAILTSENIDTEAGIFWNGPQKKAEMKISTNK